MTKRTYLFLIPVVILCFVGVWSAFRGASPQTLSSSTTDSDLEAVPPAAAKPDQAATAATAPSPSPAAKLAVPNAVKLEPDRIICSGGDGTAQEIALKELTKVSFMTQGGGTKQEENRWMLIGSSGACEFPVIAPGAEDLITWFQALPDFSYRKAIDAMSSTQDGELVVWGK